MFNIILFEPEIPPNTGNIIRLCHNTGAKLHLIHPLGFKLEDKQLRRAGLDYIEWKSVVEHQNFDTMLDSLRPKRLFAISTKGTQSYTDTKFQEGDALMFGPETRGLPDNIREHEAVTKILRIPMCADSRSLNLSNSASIILYEAWRQLGFNNSEDY